MEGVLRFLGLIPTGKDSIPEQYMARLSAAYKDPPNIVLLGLQGSGKTSFTASMHRYLSRFAGGSGIGGVGSADFRTTRGITMYSLPEYGSETVMRITDTPGKAWFSEHGSPEDDSRLVGKLLEGVKNPVDLFGSDENFLPFEAVEQGIECDDKLRPGFLFLIVDGSTLFTSRGPKYWQSYRPAVPESVVNFVKGVQKLSGTREVFIVVTHRDSLGRMKNDVRSELSVQLSFPTNRIFFIHNVTDSHSFDAKTKSQVENIVHTVFQTYLSRMQL